MKMVDPDQLGDFRQLDDGQWHVSVKEEAWVIVILPHLQKLLFYTEKDIILMELVIPKETSEVVVSKTRNEGYQREPSDLEYLKVKQKPVRIDLTMNNVETGIVEKTFWIDYFGNITLLRKGQEYNPNVCHFCHNI
jgi:hypothetical protein